MIYCSLHAAAVAVSNMYTTPAYLNGLKSQLERQRELPSVNCATSLMFVTSVLSFMIGACPECPDGTSACTPSSC